MMRRKDTVLFVDDDENILSSLQRLFCEENGRVLTARSGKEALEILENNKIHLVLSDQRMPGMAGTELLALVKERYPDILRIILVEYSDLPTIRDSIQKGHISKFFLKPWDDETLKLEIKQALNQYDLQETNRELQRKILEQNEKLKKLNDGLEQLVERKSADLVFQNWALELSRAILDELPVAIMGVSADGIVAFLNQEAQKIRFGEKKISVGDETGDYFPPLLREMISAALESQKSQKLNAYPLKGGKYEIQFTPLSGDFHKRGVILTLKPVDPP